MAGIGEHQFSKPLDGRGLELDDPMSVGVKAGGWDDAVHIVSQASALRTLCWSRADTRNVVPYADAGALGGMEGCWTCLSIRDDPETSLRPQGRRIAALDEERP